METPGAAAGWVVIMHLAAGTETTAEDTKTGAEQQSYSKVDTILRLHHRSVVRQILLHGRRGFDGRFTL